MNRLLGSVLFPGLGHLLAGRYFKGALLAVLFSLTVQTLLMGLVWPESFETTRPVMCGLALGIWTYALLSLWWGLRRAEHTTSTGQSEAVLMRGIRAMLANDLSAAEEAFRGLLRLDDRDVEGWLYLARTCQLQGQHDRARRFYRVVKNLDSRRKWTREIDVLSGGADPRPSEATP